MLEAAKELATDQAAQQRLETYLIHSLSSAPSIDRHNLRSELVLFRINVLKPIHQRDIFGTEGFFQCFNLIGQLITQFDVSLFPKFRAPTFCVTRRCLKLKSTIQPSPQRKTSID